MSGLEGCVGLAWVFWFWMFGGKGWIGVYVDCWDMVD